MKKIIYIFILFLISFKLSSQNINAEIKYLKVINAQSEELIKDNLRNAEICAFKLIQNPDSFINVGRVFFNELAISYYLTKNYDFALLSYYRQRCFFPTINDSKTNKYFFNSCENIRDLDNKFFNEIHNTTSFKNIPKSYIERFKLFLEISYKSGFKNSENFENLYSNLYREKFKDSETPYWIKQHNFYSKIGIKSKHRNNLYSFTKKGNGLFVPTDIKKNQKHKICNKAIKYYLHLKNKDMVKKYTNFCKDNGIKYCLLAKFIR